MVARVLLLLNRSSGTGHGPDLCERLRAALAQAVGPAVSVDAETVDDHPQAAARTRAFLRTFEEPVAVIAGGGGGTLRAVMEGICDVAGAGNSRVLVSGLRLGSGNVVAKQFGVPLDPLDAIRGIAANLVAGRAAPCCVMRAQFGRPGGKTDVRYASTMCGLGQFGRVPGDLARWHHRLPRLRRFIARFTGIESLNNVEYALAMLGRSAWAALCPSACETIEVESKSGKQTMRLLAGAVMNFPIKGLPFDPGIGIQDAALSLHLVPYSGRLDSLLLVLARNRTAARALRLRIEPGDCVGIRFLDRNPVEFFLDEDPEEACGKLTIQVAGTLAFIPAVG